MPDGQDNNPKKKTKIERIVKGERPEWVKKYDKDGIIIHGDPMFGRVKLSNSEGKQAVGQDIVALGGIVVFGEYYEGGVGGLKAHHPYIAKEVLDAIRGG